MDNTLSRMADTLVRGKDSHSKDLLILLENRLQACQEQLKDLKAFIAPLSPELAPTWEKLVSILRSAAAANTRSKV